MAREVVITNENATIEENANIIDKKETSCLDALRKGSAIDLIPEGSS